MDGPVECLKVLPCVDIKHCPHVIFLGPQDARHKVAHNYKHLFEIEKNALLIDPKMQRNE